MKLTATLLCWLLCVITLAASVGHVPYKRFTTGDGLPNSVLYAVFEDSKGHIWAATDDGVAVYDGYQFKSLYSSDQFASTTVLGIQEDANGRIWCRGINAIYLYDSRGEVLPCGASSEIRRLLTGRSDICFSIYVDVASTLWLSFSRCNFLIRIPATDNWSHADTVPLPNMNNARAYVYQVDAGQNSLVYGFTTGGNNNRLVEFKKTNQAGKIIPIKFVKAAQFNTYRMLVQHTNDYLIAVDHVVYRIGADGRKDSLVFSTPQIQSGTEDDKYYYISVHNEGCYRVLKSTFGTAPPELFFAGDVTGVAIDREGGFWFSTYNDGLFYQPWPTTLVVDASDGLFSSNITYLAAHQKQLYIGHPMSAFSILEGDLVQIWKGRLCKLYSIGPDSTLLAGTISGFVRYTSKQQFAGIDTLLFNNAPMRLTRSCLLPDGTVVRSVSNGLAYFRFGENLFYKKQTFPTNVSSLLVNQEGDLLIGTKGGVFREKGNQVALLDSTVDELKFSIKCIYQLPDQSYLFGTRTNGVLHYRKGQPVKRLSTEGGLLSNLVTCLIPSHDGLIWVGTSAGLQLITPELEIRLSINSSVGLPENEVNYVLELGDSVFAATSGGIFRFQRSQLYNQTIVPPIYLTMLQVNGQQLNLDTANYFELDYSQNSIRIGFVGVSMRSNGKLRYRYRLSTTEKWQYTTSTMLDFPRLLAGKYAVEVQVQALSGVWSKSARLRFIIHLPFWQQLWFRLLVIVSVAAIIFLFIWRYRRRQRKQQDERLRYTRQFEQLRLQALQAQMNPHFMFNVMGSIQHFILNNESENASNYLTRFSRLIRNVMEQSALENLPLDQEFETLELYLQLEALRLDSFTYSINYDRRLKNEGLTIPPMLIQPFVENAIWHGLLNKPNNRNLTLDAEWIGPGKFKITVEDNGVGRAAVQALKDAQRMPGHKSKGLEMTGKRLETIRYLQGREISLQTTDLYTAASIPCGTRIELYFN